MQKDVYKSWYFNQPIKEVWDYLTKPELMEQWLMKSDFRPIVGHKFQFQKSPEAECNYGGTTYCEVVEVTPFKRLSYCWRVTKGSEQVTIDSLVVWILTEKDNGTQLQLQHTGFYRVEDFISHQKGWSALVDGFKKLLSITKHETAAA